jgi:hypothetical protein
MTEAIPEPNNVGPISGGNLRASDADREQVANLLSTAYAEGRLTREEHDERVEAWRAFVPITRDLVPIGTRGRHPKSVAPIDTTGQNLIPDDHLRNPGVRCGLQPSLEAWTLIW